MSLNRAEFPTSRYANRFWWTWITTAPLMIVWGATAMKGGDQWPVAAAYCLLLFCVWATPTAEQIVNVVQAAGTLKSNPLDGLGWDSPSSTLPAPKVPDE